MKSSYLLVNVLFAWLVFIGLDFFFHAGILNQLWTEDVAAIKPLEELARLIPFGYLSFFLLVLLVAYSYRKIFIVPPTKKQFWLFIVIWALLFAASNLAGLYSYVTIPLKQLAVFNLVYFLEIVVAGYFLHLLYTSERYIRVRWLCILLFSVLVIAGVVLQNVLMTAV